MSAVTSWTFLMANSGSWMAIGVQCLIKMISDQIPISVPHKNSSQNHIRYTQSTLLVIISIDIQFKPPKRLTDLLGFTHSLFVPHTTMPLVRLIVDQCLRTVNTNTNHVKWCQKYNIKYDSSLWLDSIKQLKHNSLWYAPVKIQKNI